MTTREIKRFLIYRNGEPEYQTIHIPPHICEDKLCIRCADASCVFHFDMGSVRLELVNLGADKWRNDES